MASNGISVVDGDGHVMEDWDSLLQYMPEPYIKSGRFRGRIFPPLDHLHSASLFQLVPGAFRQVGVDGWLEFMDAAGIGGSCKRITPDDHRARFLRRDDSIHRFQGTFGCQRVLAGLC